MLFLPLKVINGDLFQKISVTSFYMFFVEQSTNLQAVGCLMRRMVCAEPTLESVNTHPTLHLALGPAILRPWGWVGLMPGKPGGFGMNGVGGCGGYWRG